MNGVGRRGVDGDDSLLASVAGVPLTRMARVAVCIIWSGFWAARVLLTDAITHISPFDAKLLSSELLGSGPVDQAFSLCMAWLSVEAAIIFWATLKMGANMLIAKTTPSLRRQVAESLTLEELEAIVEKKREKAQQGKEARANGKKD